MEIIKRTINTTELFEKYRGIMQKQHDLLDNWKQEWSVEEYMEKEGYNFGVILFLENIGNITNGDFIQYYIKCNIPYEEEDENYGSTFQ